MSCNNSDQAKQIKNLEYDLKIVRTLLTRVEKKLYKTARIALSQVQNDDHVNLELEAFNGFLETAIANKSVSFIYSLQYLNPDSLSVSTFDDELRSRGFGVEVQNYTHGRKLLISLRGPGK